MEIVPSFWKDRRVLVTGHTGFKGGWLSMWLRSLGAEVLGYSLPPPSEPSLFKLAAVDRGITSVFGDIRDHARLLFEICNFKPEVVFHLAAQALVRESYENPLDTFEVNVVGTAHVMEAIRSASGVRSVVIVTSDKCYAERAVDDGYVESDALGGHDPYSSSKACAELVTAAFRESYFSASSFDRHRLGVATARGGNAIGGGDWGKDRLLPDVMRHLTAGERPKLRLPQSVRPWQHVLDLLQGYLLLAEQLYHDGAKFSEAWNFGPDINHTRSVASVTEEIISLWGAGTEWYAQSDGEKREATSLRLNSSKARERLGWTPKLSLSTSLKWAVDWTMAVGSGGDARRISEAQISAYQDHSAR